MGNKVVRSLYISYNAITEPIVQSQVIPYLRELSKRGIKFYLLTYEKEKRDGKKLPDLADIKWYRLKYHKRPTVPATIYDIIRGTVYSLYIVIKNKIDVVHARAIIAALVGFPVAKIFGKKIIFDTRGIDSEEYVDAGLWKKGGLTHKIVGFLENVLIKSSDHVVTLTERFLEILEERHCNKKIKFSVIPCAVDINKFKQKINKNTQLVKKLKIQDKFIIAYTGSLGTWYMLPEMIDFFKVASKIMGNVRFLILTQSSREYAINLMKEKGINLEYITIETVAHDSVPSFLSVCNSGIFFIRPVFSKLSSSPVKFGEYLASGIPVIINRGIGDTDKIVRENRVGVVVEDFTEASYRKAVKELMELLNDERLEMRCRLTAERYLSLDAAVEKYDRIYKKLTGII